MEASTIHLSGEQELFGVVDLGVVQAISGVQLAAKSDHVPALRAGEKALTFGRFEGAPRFEGPALRLFAMQEKKRLC